MGKLGLMVLIACSVLTVQGQNRKAGPRPENVRINKGAPTVYIKFERAGELKSPETNEEKERVWLRLYNNTRWPLRLRMSGVPSNEYGDAKLYYDGLLKDEVVFRIRCHFCSSNLLSPGKSLLFSVPREELGAERAIRVSFNYGWEDWDSIGAGLEPEHYIYFDASKFP